MYAKTKASNSISATSHFLEHSQQEVEGSLPRCCPCRPNRCPGNSETVTLTPPLRDTRVPELSCAQHVLFVESQVRQEGSCEQKDFSPFLCTFGASTYEDTADCGCIFLDCDSAELVFAPPPSLTSLDIYFPPPLAVMGDHRVAIQHKQSGTAPEHKVFSKCSSSAPLELKPVILQRRRWWWEGVPKNWLVTATGVQCCVFWLEVCGVGAGANSCDAFLTLACAICFFGISACLEFASVNWWA